MARPVPGKRGGLKDALTDCDVYIFRRCESDLCGKVGGSLFPLFWERHKILGMATRQFPLYVGSLNRLAKRRRILSLAETSRGSLSASIRNYGYVFKSVNSTPDAPSARFDPSTGSGSRAESRDGLTVPSPVEGLSPEGISSSLDFPRDHPEPVEGSSANL